MFSLKPLSRAGIDAALNKAERYRLLNEPWQAESICRDVLDIDPTNQTAIVTMLLSLTDQFTSERNANMEAARALLDRLASEYERHYYGGIICERRASAILERAVSGTGPVAYQLFRQAMEHYERAEAIRPPGNDDALLRWNTCARAIMKHSDLQPASDERALLELE